MCPYTGEQHANAFDWRCIPCLYIYKGFAPLAADATRYARARSITTKCEGGGTHLLLALVISSLTTHPFRDGAPFLLLVQTRTTFGRSLLFFHILHRNCSLTLSPACFAVCGHHLSPRIAIVFSLLSNLPNSCMSHTSIFLVSSNASRSSLYISHSPTM